jgi:hypothetical protein
MKRWLLQRRLWAALIGTTTAFGLAFGNGGREAPAGPAKVGEVISLKFRDGPDRQFKVLQVEKQTDGSYQYELKDTKTGETLTLVDRVHDAPLTQTSPQKLQEPVAPKLNPMPASPPLPQAVLPVNPPLPPVGTAPDVPQMKSSPAKTDTKQPATAGVATMPESPQDPPKKPGLFSKIFGTKKTPPPANTNSSSATTTNTPNATTATAPVVPSTSPALPPPVRPTPGLFPPTTGTTAEPPRVLPSQPVAPPAPTLFQNSPPPALAPKPQTPPSNPPAPMVPGLPSIPIPPAGMTKNTPTTVQVGYFSPASVAMIQEIKPYVLKLRTAQASSERIYALQALAGCRHASSDTVKKVLFLSCTSDPCPLVRACCIDELCKLGYYDPAFLTYLKIAYEDPSEDVHDAAREALKKMTPTR